MLEDIRLSFKGIWAHKLRSFLTMLGIIVGIAAVIAVVSTITGTNEQIKQNLIGDGSNTLYVTLYQDGYEADFSYMEIPSGIPEYGESMRIRLLDIDGIVNASLYKETDSVSSIYYGNKAVSGAVVYGIDSAYFETSGMQLVKGRGFSENDFSSMNKVAILNRSAQTSIYDGDDPIGSTIDLNGEPFTVIGVVEKSSEFEPVINSVSDYETYAQTEATAIYVPIQTWPIFFIYDQPVNAVIKVASVDVMTSAGAEAAEAMNSRLNANDGSNIKYQSTDLAKEASELAQLSSSTNVMLIGIASISLLVGGIGVMNIMLVSVTERTREIGLKKALGAKKRRIRSQFLTEAMILSGIGGVLGVITGIILATIISAIALIPVAISIPSIIISVVFSMAIGIIFGMVPSIKASNLNPIDALRYE